MLYTKQIKEAQEADSQYWEKLYKKTFLNNHGKLVLIDMIMRSGMLDVPLSVDPNVQLVNLGRRTQVLEMLNFLEIEPADLIVAQDEAIKVADEYVIKNDFMGDE